MNTHTTTQHTPEAVLDRLEQLAVSPQGVKVVAELAVAYTIPDACEVLWERWNESGFELLMTALTCIRNGDMAGAIEAAREATRTGEGI